MHTALVYFLGPAGSGKSTMAGAFHDWLELNGYDSVLVNLDPGVRSLPYDPFIDIREKVRLDEVMERYGLGPNGAQVVCADLLALELNWLVQGLEEVDTHYILVDTPGQMELFLFREAARLIVNNLSGRSIMALLFDPLLSRTANGFVTQLMLAQTTAVRFPLPQVSLLSKVDLLEPGELERIRLWSQDLDALWLEAMDDTASIEGTLALEMVKVFQSMSTSTTLIPTSCQEGEQQGLDDLYTMIQMTCAGGEDLEK